MNFEYKKEFFDRTYTAREAYGRVWGYARKYKFRIFVGIVCGMLTAGTLVPLFQVIQPAMAKVSENEHVAALKAELADEGGKDGRRETGDAKLGNVWHVFPVRVGRRDEFQEYLTGRGIQTVIHYPIPPHRQPAYTEWHGLSLPITEQIHATIISLPISPVMTDDEVSEVIAAVNAWK